MTDLSRSLYERLITDGLEELVHRAVAFLDPRQRAEAGAHLAHHE